MAAVSTPSTSLGRSWKRKQSVTFSDNAGHPEMFVEGGSSPLRGTVSPSTVSELSVDSGVGIDEGREVAEDLDLPKEDFNDSDDSPIYENFQFFVPSSRLNRSIEDLTDALSINCGEPSIPPPPEQFSNNIGLVTKANVSVIRVSEHDNQNERHNKINKTTNEDDHIYEDVDDRDLSFILSSQNPSRIDIQTLRKNKVSRSTFATFCSKNLHVQPYGESENGSMSPDTENEYERNMLNRKEEANIMSVKGTVRGVRNRVKTGIATFLQDQKKKNYIATEGGLCVVFVTSLGVVRETRTRCSSVRKILRNLCVRVSERDVLMSREHYLDLRDRLGISDLSTQIDLPQVFLNGQLLGDAALMERINESGELRKLVKPLQDPVGVQNVCGKCGGFGMFPCPSCDGSKKSGWRSTHNTIILRCTHCDEGGLVRCDQC